MHRPAATPVSPLSSEELTGRSSRHVRDLAVPPCTLHPAVIPALHSMRASAAADGLDLLPVSGFRDFNRQLRIWNANRDIVEVVREISSATEASVVPSAPAAS